MNHPTAGCHARFGGGGNEINNPSYPYHLLFPRVAPVACQPGRRSRGRLQLMVAERKNLL